MTWSECCLFFSTRKEFGWFPLLVALVGSLHTRDWEPVTSTLRALSLVGKAEPGPSSIHTTLEGPTEYICKCKIGCKVCVVSCVASIGSCVHGCLDFFQKPLLGGRSITKLGDHGTSNVHNCWFILFCHVWGPAWIEIHRNSVWLRVRSHMASHCTWGYVTTLHDCGGVLGRSLDTFLWALIISWSRLLARVWGGP